MKNQNKQIERMKTIAAQRLTEVMALRKMESPSKIKKELEEKYNYPINRQTFYKYQKAVNSMPHDFIVYVAAILNIDSGYLEGKDNFLSASYSEYLEDIQQIDELRHHNNDFDKYNKLLKCADMLLSSGTTPDNSDVDYSVTQKDSLDTHYRYSSTEMEELYQNCVKIIRQSFCPDDGQ